MHTGKSIHIAIAFDRNYIIPCYVLLTSIFDNNRTHCIAVHAIATGLEPAEKQQLTAFVEQHNGTMTFYEVDEQKLQHVVLHSNSHLTIATYYRLFFPMLVSEKIGKLLYLDMDIVVVGSLAALYDTELGEYAIAAVPDFKTVTQPDMGLTEPYSYLNAGVMLMNTAAWQEQKVTERAFEYMYQYPEKIKLGDQDALNGAMQGNWLRLDLKYNVTLFDIPVHLPRKAYKSFLSDKVVIHYTKGKHKPWLLLNKNKFRYLYHHYLRLSPVPVKRKYNDFRLKPIILYRLLKIRTEELLAGYPRLYKVAKVCKLV